MGDSSLVLGAEAVVEMVVRVDDLASCMLLSENSFPDLFPSVFATPKMIALMELASARVLEPHLTAGQRSVGCDVEATHCAATAVGAVVQAVARCVGGDGKLFVFQVVASDGAGVIGRMRHTRAVIDRDRLEARAGRRCLSEKSIL